MSTYEDNYACFEAVYAIPVGLTAPNCERGRATFLLSRCVISCMSVKIFSNEVF